MKQLLQEIAAQLDQAALNAQATSQLSFDQSITLDDAYQIQKASIQRRIERGEVLAGFKLGFTSKAKMEQMGINDIIWGRLTHSMEIKSGDMLEMSKFIHPRAEPEIAFRMGKQLDRYVSLEEVPQYIDAIAVAIEVIDSRYEHFKFSLEDVVADNCSSAAYMIGEWLPSLTDVQGLHITLQLNGETVQTGNSHAILGNPLQSIVEISKMMVKYGEVVQAGDIILAGAATSAIYINAGDRIGAHFGKLGSVELNVAKA